MSALCQLTQDEQIWVDELLQHCNAWYPVPLPENKIEIAWVAGLLEGEASFMPGKNSPTIAIQMTDADIISRVAAILGTNPQAPWVPKGKPSYKTVHHCTLNGVRAVMWMLALYPFLGTRRRKKIREILTYWKRVAHARSPRGQSWPALCHPTKPRCGEGLCRTCYMRVWRERRKQAGAVQNDNLQTGRTMDLR